MSAKQSNLSSTGFDYVVGVTQNSINATLEAYLYRGLPEAILCYVYDESNNLVPADYPAFVKKAGGTDPFAVPDGTPSTDPRVQALNAAFFAFAVKAKLGLPPGVPPAKLPPIVALKPGQSNVTYTLMFAEFVATEIVFGPRGSVVWVNQSQPAGTAWTFTGAVDLNFQDASFTRLSPAAQDRLKAIGDPNEFSVRQLYYDLNSSDLEQGFQFDKVPSNSTLNTFMTADFINTYWKALGGASVLGYGAKQLKATPSTGLAVTDLNFFTPDAVGGGGAPLTLNYLCATNHDRLPDTTHAGFGWNWIDPGEESQYHGVAALNRNTFAKHLAFADFHDGGTLLDYVKSNCYQPWVRLTYVGGIGMETKMEWRLPAGQTPTIAYPPTGGAILTYHHKSPVAADQSGLNGSLARMELSSEFTLTISVSGNTMVVVQHLVVWIYVRSLATSASGNVVDKQITDTYTLGVDTGGKIVMSVPSADAHPPTSVLADKSETPSANGFLNFWAPINELIAGVAVIARNCTGTRLKSIPVSAVQDFVFPGNATFSFADVAFSDNQDLVSHIVYVAGK